MATAVEATNSYITYGDANNYFGSRMHVERWEESLDRDKALIWASKLLDTYVRWDGSKTVTSQAMEFPRTNLIDRDGEAVDSATIPTFLKDATCELAFYLLDNDIQVSQSSKDRSSFMPEIVKMLIADYGVTGYVRLTR